VFALDASLHAWFVFGLIALAAAAMLSNKVRYDFIAIGVISALTLSGIMSAREAVSGFGNSVVVLIAGLLVIGEMLDKTGVASITGDIIQSAGKKSKHGLLAIIMLASAFLSAIMSSTAVVAIFIPVILGIAKRNQLPASSLLLPMSFAALVSGMLTLIATPPNLVISARLSESGYAPLGFFSFSLPGLLILAATIIFVVFAGRKLLPQNDAAQVPDIYHRKLAHLMEDYRSDREITDVVISARSSLNGVTVGMSELYTGYGIRIIGIARHQNGQHQYFTAPHAGFVLSEKDILHLSGDPEQLHTACTSLQLKPVTLSATQKQQENWELGATAVLIHPNSRLAGKTIKDVRFRDRYHLDVIGLRRNQQAIPAAEDVRLAPSDSLLVTGAWKNIKALEDQNHDFVVLERASEGDDVAPAYKKMPLALIIVAVMVLISLFDVMPLVIAVLMLVAVAVTGRCLSAEEAYRAIHWQSLVLIAGMLPLATALDTSGGTKMIVGMLMTLAGGKDPQVLLVLLFFITVVLTNFLSNTASAVLMAPIAITAAEQAGVSPYPLAVTVLFAASAAFLTPVASPVVTLVVEPGRYRFIDFIKLGTPLLLIVFAVTYWFVPLVFPWQGKGAL